MGKRTHFNTLKNNTRDNPKLQASWNKYSKEKFWLGKKIGLMDVPEKKNENNLIN